MAVHPPARAVAVHPSAFPLGQVAGILLSTRATMLQPSVRALVHGTHHSFLRVKPAHMSCLATTAQWVEMQTPLFAGEAWAAYHSSVLSHIADEDLAASDYGIDISWCAAVRDAFPSRPACLVTPAEAATHLNTHAIEKFMSKEVIRSVRSCAGTCHTIHRLYRSYVKNFSHHTGECYGITLGEHSQHGVLRGGGRFAIDGSGYARARYEIGGLRTHGSAGKVAPLAETVAVTTGGAGGGGNASAVDDQSRAPISDVWFGVTSLASRGNSDRLYKMVSALLPLLKSRRNLRIAINLDDGPTDGTPRTNAPLEVSNDLRISTTWINGPRARVWKVLCDPRSDLMRGVSYVWLMDPSVGLHPSLNPISMFVEVQRATDASVVFSTPPAAAANTRGDDAAIVDRLAAAGGATVTKNDVSCAAATAKRALLGTFAVIKRDVWDTFHAKALDRLFTPRPPWPRGTNIHIARALEELVCGLASRLRRDPPACVEVFTPVVHILDRRASESEAKADARLLLQLALSSAGMTKGSLPAGKELTRPGCSAPCAAALEAAYGPAILNASSPRGACCWHGGEAATSREGSGLEVYNDSEYVSSADGSAARLNRCWVVGPMKEGLSLSKASFKRIKYHSALLRMKREAAMATIQQSVLAERKDRQQHRQRTAGGKGR